MLFRVTYLKADGTSASASGIQAANVQAAVQAYMSANNVVLGAGDEFRVATRLRANLQLEDSAQE